MRTLDHEGLVEIDFGRSSAAATTVRAWDAGTSSVPVVVSLRPDAIQLFDRRREVHVATPRKRLPIWAVVVDGEVYVRSYRGERGAWYRRAVRNGRMKLEGIDVRVEPQHDPELNERISDAFRAKYGGRSPGPTEAMVSPEVVATTLRLTRAE